MSKKKGEDVYVKIATKLIGSDWKNVFAALDGGSKKKLFAQLDSKKAILKKRASMNKKSGGKSPKAKNEKKENDDDRGSRKIAYRFGSRKLQVLRPTKGYPDKKTAKRAVEGKLKLFYAHGYSGNFDESRQNIYLSADGKYLLYYIAAVVVVYDYKGNTQRFFTKHNDDITTICVSPKKTWCASGQKDPKDEPGKGKDLPKVYVWNYKTMKSVQLIDNVCWGKVARLNWSPVTDYLYCICGDPDQTLKAWNPKNFDGKKKEVDSLIKCNTMRELILGFEINPKPAKESVDEFLLFGKRKFAYVTITKGKKGLAAKIKACSIASFKKDGEKSFYCGQFLDDGRYLVGSSSGAIYVGKGKEALAILEGAHDRGVGCMRLASPKKLITAGSDRKMKTFSIGKTEGGKGKACKSGLEQTWECSVEIKESDMVLQPRAMAYNNKTGTCFVGTKTNQIMQFEMKSEEAKVIVDGHDGQIWGLCTSPKLKLFATGGYDNAVKIWNAATMKCIATHEFELTDDNKKGYEVCSAAWSNVGDVLAFGTEDSNIAIFTYRKNKLVLRTLINIPPKNENAEVEGVAYLRFSEDGTLLAAAHMDSNLYVYILTGCDTEDIKLDCMDPMPHVAAPTNVQFSADGTIVKTLTRDYEIAHWVLDRETKKGKFLATQPDPDKCEWADDPLIAGWDTQGLYQKGWDGTDLNDATVTSDNKLIVSGDDYGTVRLHNYPAIDQTACIEYSGHAEFVVGVEFLRDDSQLITCGGNDMAIFQWKLIKK